MADAMDVLSTLFTADRWPSGISASTVHTDDPQTSSVAIGYLRTEDYELGDTKLWMVRVVQVA